MYISYILLYIIWRYFEITYRRLTINVRLAHFLSTRTIQIHSAKLILVRLFLKSYQ